MSTNILGGYFLAGAMSASMIGGLGCSSTPETEKQSYDGALMIADLVSQSHRQTHPGDEFETNFNPPTDFDFPADTTPLPVTVQRHTNSFDSNFPVYNLCPIHLYFFGDGPNRGRQLKEFRLFGDPTKTVDGVFPLPQKPLPKEITPEFLEPYEPPAGYEGFVRLDYGFSALVAMAGPSSGFEGGVLNYYVDDWSDELKLPALKEMPWEATIVAVAVYEDDTDTRSEPIQANVSIRCNETVP